MGEGGEDEPDEDDEQEAGEREVRGPAAAPARLLAENEEAPRRRPRQEGHRHGRVEGGGLRLEPGEPDPDAERERGQRDRDRP